MSRRKDEPILRALAILQLLQGSQYGLTVEELEGALGASRATLYRDLDRLRLAGFPLTTKENGKTRHVLLRNGAVIQRSLEPREWTALDRALACLEPLRGTSIHKALEAFVKKRPAYAELGDRATPTTRQKKRPSAEAIASVLERAIEHGRRVALTYRAATRGGKPHRYRLDPLHLWTSEGDLYLGAYAVDRDGAAVGEKRVFKVSRAAEVEYLDENAKAHPELPLKVFVKGAVKAWTGEEAEVAIRLSAHVAWRAEEYPLIDGQTLQQEVGGSVTLRARVAGLEEAKRYVLGFGPEAEALEPKALRDGVAAELRDALAKYGAASRGGGSAKARRAPRRAPKSRPVLPRREEPQTAPRKRPVKVRATSAKVGQEGGRRG